MNVRGAPALLAQRSKFNMQDDEPCFTATEMGRMTVSTEYPSDRNGRNGRTWQSVSSRLSVALVLDALDGLGHRHQALQPAGLPRTAQSIAIGYAKTLQWVDLDRDDPNTYDLELRAIDSLRPGEMIVCATAESARSGIWGELLTTAAIARGATGVVTDGAVRDIARIETLGFPVFSRHVSALDSFNRQKVVDFDVTVELGGVSVAPGDLIIADRDGIAVVPKALESEVLEAALDKATREDGFRKAVRDGMALVAAYERFRVL